MSVASGRLPEGETDMSWVGGREGGWGLEAG